MSTSDQELFDAAISGAEPPAPAPAEPVETTAEVTQPRDDAGRFAAKDEEQPAPVEPPEQTERPGFVPSHRLKEEADRARRVESENAELRKLLLQMNQPRQPETVKPEQPVPDIFEAPDQWADHRIKATVDPVMQQMRTVLMHNAKLVASSIHGADKITAAEAAFNEAAQRGAVDPADYQRVQNDPNPFDAAVRWYERQSLLSEIGADPQAYRQKIIADYLASQGGGQPNTAPAQAAGGTVVKLPPSVNRMTSAASDRGPAQDVGDMELFNATTSRRR